MGDDVFVEEESIWKGETRGECRSLIRRWGWGVGGMNPELRWRVNFSIDLRLPWSRRGGGRERWRCRESVSFTHISCQFLLQLYLTAVTARGAAPPSRAVPVTSRHKAHWLQRAGSFPLPFLLGVSISQHLTLTLSRGFSSCSQWPLRKPPANTVLLGWF